MHSQASGWNDSREQISLGPSQSSMTPHGPCLSSLTHTRTEPFNSPGCER